MELPGAMKELGKVTTSQGDGIRPTSQDGKPKIHRLLSSVLKRVFPQCGK
jgi:hypothetical protein